MATTIYALCEPDLQVPVIRYIGKTGKSPQKRLSKHLSASVRQKNHLGSWLRSLKDRNESPVLMALTEVPDEIGSAAEMLYIRLAREGGMNLVNGTDGGEGVTMTLEICKRIGDRNRGKKRTGVPRGPHPPGQCAAISSALTGVPLSPAHCAAISAAKTGLPQRPRSPEHCTALREAWVLRKMPRFSDGGGI